MTLFAKPHRRALIAGLAALPVATSWPALAQRKTPEAKGSASAADLAVPSPLGDITMGAADAKVTIYEYASVTCGACAKFHAETFPAVKSKYIETGKVRFVFREFSRNPLDTAGYMLGRCAPEGRYYPLMDLLFAKQESWAFVDKPVSALSNLVKQAGFTQESFEACLKRNDIYEGVSAVQKRATEVLKVDATPTFFINGQKYSGWLTIEEFDAILAPLLGA